MPTQLLSASTPIVLQRENSQGCLGVQSCSPPARMGPSGGPRPTQPSRERDPRERDCSPQEARSPHFYQTPLPLPSLSSSASSAPRPDMFMATGAPPYPPSHQTYQVREPYWPQEHYQSHQPQPPHHQNQRPQPPSRPMLPSFAELSKGLEQSSHEDTPEPLSLQVPSSRPSTGHLDQFRSRPRASSSPHAFRTSSSTFDERRPGSSGLTSSWIPWEDPGKGSSHRATLHPPSHLAGPSRFEHRHHPGWSSTDRSPTWQSVTPPHLSQSHRYHPFHREVSHSPTQQHLSLTSGGIVPAPTTRRRGKLPKDTVDQLTQWLMEHRSHPYPNEEEKRRMCLATGLNISQVSNWFINARRRILGKAKHSDGGSNHGDHHSC